MKRLRAKSLISPHECIIFFWLKTKQKNLFIFCDWILKWNWNCLWVGVCFVWFANGTKNKNLWCKNKIKTKKTNFTNTFQFICIFVIWQNYLSVTFRYCFFWCRFLLSFSSEFIQIHSHDASFFVDLRDMHVHWEYRKIVRIEAIKWINAIIYASSRPVSLLSSVSTWQPFIWYIHLEIVYKYIPFYGIWFFV